MKEHWDACQNGTLQKSTLAEHAWENHHPIRWEEATVIDQARTPKADAQGGNPHQAEPPLPQQGWWAGATWMLDGCLEEGNPATSGDAP